MLSIMGREGLAAIRAEDFVFAKFCFLQNILQVHGHWFYNRMATLVHFFFFCKSIACFGKYLIFISSLHLNLVLYLGGVFLYQFFSDYSKDKLYDSINIM